jgi:uncharacterized protein (TIGR00251 family)
VTVLRRDGEDFLLACRVQPRARHNTFGEVRNGELIIKLHAPPVDGKANDELLRFVASVFCVALRDVSIERGERSRHKVLRIERAHGVPLQLSGLMPNGNMS